jgi:hypothetical protein
MTTPAVYQGLVPNKTNGGLTPLQLALANAMATGNLPFGVNLDFLAAMRTYAHSDPLLPINFETQGLYYAAANGTVYTGSAVQLNTVQQGIAVRKTTAPDITRNISGVMYTILGDDIYVLRQAPDCGIDENRFEQTYIGKKATIAAGSFAYYGKKVIFGGPAAVGVWHGGCCFIAGTKITMADGSTKNIEEVEIGEQVTGKDNVVNTVIEFIRPVLGDRKLVGFNNGIPFITSDHPVYTKDGWKSYDPIATMEKYSVFNDNPVKQLMPGDTIETLDGQGLCIESIQTEDAFSDLQVYNFELDGNSTYIANNLIVHNKGASTASCGTGSSGCSAGG